VMAGLFLTGIAYAVVRERRKQNAMSRGFAAAEKQAAGVSPLASSLAPATADATQTES